MHYYSEECFMRILKNRPIITLTVYNLDQILLFLDGFCGICEKIFRSINGPCCAQKVQECLLSLKYRHAAVLKGYFKLLEVSFAYNSYSLEDSNDF